VLKKASRKSDVVDVRADDPEHAMERFNEGLRRVLAATKPTVTRRKKKRTTAHIGHAKC
jgi:hypothetical protein